MSSIIKVHSISKSFVRRLNRQRYLTLREMLSGFYRKNSKETFWALKNISFHVEAGETVGIIGENGAGKTTLLKLLARITPPNEGEIVIRGRVASLLEVGTGFHPELTGRENILFNGAILGLTRKQILKKFDEIVAFSETGRFLDTPLKHYSTGMSARLAFSVAAHLDPDILFIDEVLSVGDTAFQERCLTKMNDLSKSGRTVLFVSHNLAAIRQLCNRCLYISNGVLVQDGPVDEIIDTYLSHNLIRQNGVVDFTQKGAPSDSKPIKFTKIEFRNQADVLTNQFYLHDDLYIHLFLESFEKIQTVKIIFNIADMNGKKICTVYDSDSGFTLTNVSGERHLSICMKDLRFYPGDYTLDIELRSETYKYQFDSYDTVTGITLKILNTTVVNRTLKHDAGVIYVTPEWKEYNT